MSRMMGRIKGSPRGAVTPNLGPNPTESEAALSIDMATCEPQEIRDNAIRLLDNARREYSTARYNRIRSMQLARACGLSCSEIGEVLGVTDSGVRKALQRAGDA